MNQMNYLYRIHPAASSHPAEAGRKRRYSAEESITGQENAQPAVSTLWLSSGGWQNSLARRRHTGL